LVFSFKISILFSHKKKPCFYKAFLLPISKKLPYLALDCRLLSAVIFVIKFVFIALIVKVEKTHPLMDKRFEKNFLL